MSEEILINVTPQETRIGIIENGILQEVHIERTNKRGMVGNISKGKVSRVLPGMQSAFIDIGLERTGFLHISDIVDSYHDTYEDPVVTNIQPPAISSVLREGQEVLVQVIKDPLGSKGARLTTRLSIPSRYLVYLPANPLIAISQRIEDQEERVRLQQIILNYHQNRQQLAVNAGMNVVSDITSPSDDVLKWGGFIIRTAAEGAAEAEIRKDIEYLYKSWGVTNSLARKARAPELVYEDLPLAMRTIRDLVRSGVEKVRIDSRETFERALVFSQQFIPEFVDRIEHYSGERPLMDMYSVEDEIQRSLNRKVLLKSGGHL